MSFAAIIATRNGTEGSNFHIRNTMTAIVEVSGNRLVCIVACDRATVLAKPSPQTRFVCAKLSVVKYSVRLYDFNCTTDTEIEKNTII